MTAAARRYAPIPTRPTFGAFGLLGALGASLEPRQQIFCGTNKNPSTAHKHQLREQMRAALAMRGVRTYPGIPWQPDEQAAWNAYNVSKGLKPMLFGKYPMGTQCDALWKGAAKFQATRATDPVAGFGSVESIDSIADRNGSDDEIMDSLEAQYQEEYLENFPRGSGVRRDGLYDPAALEGLGSMPYSQAVAGLGEDTAGSVLTEYALRSLVWAACGYYVGKKLGPSGSSAGIAGAVAGALAGPVGLAGVAAYYAK